MKMKIRRAKFFHGHVLLGKFPVHLFFLLFSAHAFERNCENTKTAWSGDSTTENAIYDENMKIVGKKIEAYLEKNTSNNRKVNPLDNM